MLLQGLCSISPHLATALVILLKLDSNRRFFSPCDLEIWWMTQKNNRVPLLCYFKFLQHFIAIGDFKLELLSGNAQFGSNSTIYIEEHIYIFILTELLDGNKGHQEETHHPTHRFRRLFLDLLSMGWRGCASAIGAIKLPPSNNW